MRREADEIHSKGEVIIAGHGRFGGIVNRMLRAAGYSTTVVDYSSQQLERLRSYGIDVYFGDASRRDLLHAAGIETAKMLVVAVDGRDKISDLVRYAVKAHPHLHVLSRAYDRHHVYELWSLGCRDIVRETYDSSIRAGRSALEALGIAQDDADAFAREFEARDRSSMVTLADLYDPDVPSHENPAYVAKIREVRAAQEEELRGKMDGLASARRLESI